MDMKFDAKEVVGLQPYLNGINIQLNPGHALMIYLVIPSITMVVLENQTLIIELNNGKNIKIENGGNKYYETLIGLISKYDTARLPKELTCNADKFKCNYY
jgi:hypothetical protein